MRDIKTLKGKDSHDCTKSYYLIGYSIRVQSPKVVDMKKRELRLKLSLLMLPDGKGRNILGNV